MEHFDFDKSETVKKRRWAKIFAKENERNVVRVPIIRILKRGNWMKSILRQINCEIFWNNLW